MKKEYTLTVYTEDQIGLINKITIMFSRKKVELKSLNVSSSEIDKMYRFTIVITETPDAAKNLVHQIEKIIEFFKCYCNTNEEIFSIQTALYKLKTNIMMKAENMDDLMRKFNAKFLSIEKKYSAIEATGSENDIDNLTAVLYNYGLVEFVKSSKISLNKSSDGFTTELFNMEENQIKQT